jgi:hypothetical protein
VHRVTSAVVVALSLSGCHSLAATPVTVGDCPKAKVTIRSEVADGLPPVGSTTLERVREGLAMTALIRHDFGAERVVVAPRDGQVWARTAAQRIVIRDTHDYLLEVHLSSERQCPRLPASYGGIPLKFVVDPPAGSPMLDASR